MAEKRAKGPKSRKSRKAPFSIAFSGVTDVGLVREGNEDSLLAHPHQGLYVVADGMGGHNCGEVASQFAVEAMMAFYDSDDITRRVKDAHKQAVKQLPKSSRDPSFHALRLRKATESANISVYRLSQQHEALRDMGTTVVAAAFSGSRLYVANVGDSRVYRMRRGELVQLTEDHSLVNEYLKMNMLRPEDVESFPYKNVIVRAVGLHERVTVDVTWTTVKTGDQILLCSDGLTDLVKDDAIAHVLDSSDTPEQATARLVEYAKDAGGHDNITALLLELQPFDEDAPELELFKRPLSLDEASPAAEVGSSDAPTDPPPASPPPNSPPPKGPAPSSPPPSGPAPGAE
ncbi:MAG: Stp1/IreP family PP2C-type Ser/Thr phosphatase [Myxococcales bacterium]|nr:Stp1/IreP family PP2C-type Ser/Thr phosphatase [Myxococcales bacterium]